MCYGAVLAREGYSVGTLRAHQLSIRKLLVVFLSLGALLAGVAWGAGGQSGSAAGPLGCYLVAHAVVDPANAATIMNLQGVRMGRPSVIHMAIASDGPTITRVRVGGEAVLAGEGTLYV